VAVGVRLAVTTIVCVGVGVAVEVEVVGVNVLVTAEPEGVGLLVGVRTWGASVGAANGRSVGEARTDGWMGKEVGVGSAARV